MFTSQVTDNIQQITVPSYAKEESTIFVVFSSTLSTAGNKKHSSGMTETIQRAFGLWIWKTKSTVASMRH